MNMSYTPTLDKCYLEYSNLTAARSRRELALAGTIQLLIGRLDQWKADVEANPTLPPGVVVRESFLKLREARHEAEAVLRNEMPR